MTEKQINFSGRAHCQWPHAVLGSMAGHQCWSEVKRKKMLQEQGENPAQVTLSGVWCHFHIPVESLELFPCYRWGI